MIILFLFSIFRLLASDWPLELEYLEQSKSTGIPIARVKSLGNQLEKEDRFFIAKVITLKVITSYFPPQFSAEDKALFGENQDKEFLNRCEQLPKNLSSWVCFSFYKDYLDLRKDTRFDQALKTKTVSTDYPSIKIVRYLVPWIQFFKVNDLEAIDQTFSRIEESIAEIFINVASIFLQQSGVKILEEKLDLEIKKPSVPVEEDKLKEVSDQVLKEISPPSSKEEEWVPKS